MNDDCCGQIDRLRFYKTPQQRKKSKLEKKSNAWTKRLVSDINVHIKLIVEITLCK
jgi:hypothetical protein